jgi:fibronectin type 3 domain-containing protein
MGQQPWITVATQASATNPVPGSPTERFFNDFGGAAPANEPMLAGVSYQYAIAGLTGTTLSTILFDVGSSSFGPPTLAGSGQTSTWNSTATTPVDPTLITPATTPYPDRVLLTFATSPGASQSYLERRVFTTDATAPFYPLATVVVGYNFYDDATAISQVMYQYRIRSFSASFGLSGYSPAITGCKLSAPPIQSASDAEFADKVVITWDSPTDWLADGFKVFRKKSGDYSATAWVDLTPTALSNTTLSFDDSISNPDAAKRIVPGQVYDYAVTGLWNTAPTGVPATPTVVLSSQRGLPNIGMLVVPPATGLTASSNLAGYINLEWVAPANAASTISYQIQRRLAGSTDAFRTIRTQQNTRYLDSAVTIGVSYEYRIVTVASNGVTSVPSASATGVRVETPQTPDAP